MKSNLILYLSILVSMGASAQTNLDSLWGVWGDESKADTVRLKALDNFIYYGYISKKLDSAIHFARIQNEFAVAKGLKDWSADALFNQANACFNSGQLLDAIIYYKEALELYEELGNKNRMSRTYSRMGWVKWTDGKYNESREYHYKGLALAEELGDTMAMSLFWRAISYSDYLEGRYLEGIKKVKIALKLSEAINDESGIAWILNAIGSSYSTEGDDENALIYFRRSLEMQEKLGLKLDIAYTLGNIGGILADNGENAKALELYERSLALSEEMNDKRRTAYTLASIGELHETEGREDKALEYFQRSLTLSQEIGNKDMEGSILTTIGEHHNSQRSYLLGIRACRLAYNIALETGSFADQAETCECLYNSYKSLGDNKMALEYYELYQINNDSLKRSTALTNLQEMEFTNKMFADSIRQEEEKLKIEITHQAELGEKDRSRNIFSIIALIILFLTVGLWGRTRFIKKANVRLKQERDRAESSEHFKHQFLANMSHEIRTPMNAIKGMSDILIRRDPKEDQIEYLSGIKESSASLLVIINDILDLSKIEVGKIDFEKIPFSISDIVKNVDTIMQFKAQEKHLDLICDMPENTPLVLGDPTRLRQVIINLIGNAIKFTDKGSVTCALTIEEEKDNPNQNFHFVVSDTGIGIEPDQLEQVFNSFEQAYSDTTRKYGGTGLGLSISKKLVDLQGGRIWLESQVGEGSQFHFLIPFPISEGLEQAEENPLVTDIETMSAQLKGVKILLAEDNAFNAVVAREELEDAIEDVEIVVAQNGSIAVEQISYSDFDLVLMDVQMPIMNGYDATKGIRALEGERAKIPIIAMTANIMKAEVELCLKAGMDDFIGKPFEIEELLEKIYGQLHGRS